MFVSPTLLTISFSKSRSFLLVPATLPGKGDFTLRVEVEAMDPAGDARPSKEGVTDVARKLLGARRGGGGMPRTRDGGRDIIAGVLRACNAAESERKSRDLGVWRDVKLDLRTGVARGCQRGAAACKVNKRGMDVNTG